MFNTGYKGYNRRRRKINGVYDGYVEDNLPAEGLGPYIPTELDYQSCPTTSTTTSTSTSTSTTLAPVLRYVEDTTTCEQSMPFTEIKEVSGFSSPIALYYDPVSGRFITVDQDDINGNVYSFNPDTLNSYSDRTVAPGIVDKILCYDWDATNRKLWVAGNNTDGAKVYDVATNTTSTVNYGINVAYGRVLLRILGNTVYASTAANVNAVSDMVLINKTTQSVTTLSNASIPSGNIYFYKSFGIQLVGNEIWCYANQRYDGRIAVYNSTLTSLITVITLPGAVTISGWGFNQFWQGHYYDEANNRWYAHDIGSNTWHVINTITKTVIKSTTMINRQGKSFSAFGFLTNPVTNDLYLSGNYLNSASDNNQIKATYKLSRTDYSYNYVYNTAFSALTLRTSTNEVWGVFTGNVYSQTGTLWNTDGLIIKNIIGGNGTTDDNTSVKIVLTLKQINEITGIPTGLTKLNQTGDPDYIAPYIDLTACAITYNTACPVLAATAFVTSINFEFSLDNPVINNPNIKTVRVNAKIGTTTITTKVFSLPNTTPNYFNGTLSGLTSATSYVLSIDYLDASNNIYASCNNLKTISTT